MRNRLYERIDRRGKMMDDEQGRDRRSGGTAKTRVKREMVSMQGLGYKEMLGYLEENIRLKKHLSDYQRDTRHFRKASVDRVQKRTDVIWDR